MTDTAPRAITWIDGEWIEGNPPLLGPMTHATWMASVVFDGARSIKKLAPDLDLHCARVIRSAEVMGLMPPVTAAEIEQLAWEGIDQFDDDAELYIRPLMYSEEGFVVAVPDSTRFVLSVFEAPVPPGKGLKVCLSSFRRPAPETAPTEAKTACLYPNVARALREARGKGFDSAVMLDLEDNVAELATANIFMVKDGKVATPECNGTFLNGITRQRTIQLLSDEGRMEVEERRITYDELCSADELFATGNYTKINPVLQIDDRPLAVGPITAQARDLYFAYAERAGRKRR
jgi:branched-chain amino acid aminotransferase